MKVGDKVMVDPRLHEDIWCIPMEKVKGKIMTITSIDSPRSSDASCLVKESGYIFKLDMFIPVKGTLFLAIYKRRHQA